MKLTPLFVGALLLFVQPRVGSSQDSRPRLLIDPVPAPCVVYEFRYVESQPPLMAAELKLVCSSQEKITSAAVLVTFWRQGRPVSGRLWPVSGDSIAMAHPLLIRFDLQRTRADSLVASVFKAQGPTFVWRLPSELLRSLGERLFPGLVIPRSSAAGTGASQGQNASPAGANGCTITLSDCVAAAKDACGDGNVGGVAFSSSTCTCCFYCRGEQPPDCPGND